MDDVAKTEYGSPWGKSSLVKFSYMMMKNWKHNKNNLRNAEVVVC